MPGITRDAAFPDNVAQLMAMMNQVCEGYNVLDVLQAATNMQAAAINVFATANKMDAAAFALFREEMLARLRVIVDMNRDRKPLPTDIRVKPQ